MLENPAPLFQSCLNAAEMRQNFCIRLRRPVRRIRRCLRDTNNRGYVSHVPIATMIQSCPAGRSFIACPLVSVLRSSTRTPEANLRPSSQQSSSIRRMERIGDDSMLLIPLVGGFDRRSRTRLTSSASSKCPMTWNGRFMSWSPWISSKLRPGIATCAYDPVLCPLTTVPRRNAGVVLVGARYASTCSPQARTPINSHGLAPEGSASSNAATSCSVIRLATSPIRSGVVGDCMRDANSRKSWEAIFNSTEWLYPAQADHSSIGITRV